MVDEICRIKTGQVSPGYTSVIASPNSIYVPNFNFFRDNRL